MECKITWYSLSFKHQLYFSFLYSLGFKAHNVGKDLGLSHHYRICEFGGFECMKNPSVVDTTAQNWGKLLIPNVQEVCGNIFGGVGCPEAPALGSPWWSDFSSKCKK